MSRRFHEIEGWKALVTDDVGKAKIEELRTWWDEKPRMRDELPILRQKMGALLKGLMYDGRIFHKDGTPYVMYRRGK